MDKYTEHDFRRLTPLLSLLFSKTRRDTGFDFDNTFRVGLGVGGAVIAPGLRACPSHLCDGWVCGLGAVDASLVFGLVRGTGDFAAVLPSFVLLSKMPFAQHSRGFATSFSAASSSRLEAMVGGALERVSAFRVGLGVSGATIVSGS